MKSLKALREARSLTQSQVSSYTGLSNLTICNIENSKIQPEADTRTKIETYFGQRVNWIETLGLKEVPAITWEKAEENLRKAILSSYSLNDAHREQFILVAKEYIQTFGELLAAEEEDEEIPIIPELQEVFRKNRFR